MVNIHRPRFLPRAYVVTIARVSKKNRKRHVRIEPRSINATDNLQLPICVRNLRQAHMLTFLPKT